MNYSLFAGLRRVASGTLAELSATVVATKGAGEPGGISGPFLVFEDDTGRQVDIDRTGSDAQPSAAASVDASVDAPAAEDTARRGPGRPRLGVVAREVTLLPHHWEWLNAQPGGASVTLRKLVEVARKSGAVEEKARLAREAAYRFLHAIGGNLPDFEEVTRALFAGDLARMATLMHAWPADVRQYALQLATPRD